LLTKFAKKSAENLVTKHFASVSSYTRWSLVAILFRMLVVSCKKRQFVGLLYMVGSVNTQIFADDIVVIARSVDAVEKLQFKVIHTDENLQRAQNNQSS
jgi:hypothetical protein